MQIFIEYIITLGWALTAAVSVALAISLGLKVFNYISPLDEWEEIRKSNIAMALVLSSVVIGMSLVVAFTING